MWCWPALASILLIGVWALPCFAQPVRNTYDQDKNELMIFVLLSVSIGFFIYWRKISSRWKESLEISEIQRNNAIVEREGYIVEYERVVSELDKALLGRDLILSERDQISAERDRYIVEYERVVSELDKALLGRDLILSDRAQISAERDGYRTRYDRVVLERDQAIAERNMALAEHASGLAARVAELEKECARLRERGKLAVAQRDQWERRAVAAEQKLTNASHTEASSTRTKKYELLKRFIAKEFHPDHSSASGIERAVRTETFKVIWAKIDELDKA